MDKQRKVKFITFGCRVNQYDSQALREMMKPYGFRSAGRDNRLDEPDVDVVIINTIVHLFITLGVSHGSHNLLGQRTYSNY